jgi:RNA polymerase sigma-70 factor (ECF subfamily)
MNRPTASHQPAHQWAYQSTAQEIPSDAALIAAVLGGDTEQFSLLVTRHQQRVMRFILRYEYNTHDAQDLAQETFLQAFRGLSGFHAEARFSTWLTGIAFNLLKNHISRSPTKQYLHLDIEEQAEGECSVASDNPAQAYERNQLLSAMERAVAALAPSMRDPLVLVASEGMSYEEAADLLKLPIGTLKSRLCRARLQLADDLRAFRVAC